MVDVSIEINEVFQSSLENITVRYLDFGNRLFQSKSGICPHFFRGMCTDWLYFDIGLSEESTARYIGDLVQTLKMAYLDRNLPYDSKEALTRHVKISVSNVKRMMLLMAVEVPSQ